MRYLSLLLIALVLVGCSDAQATRVDERTWRIEGPGVVGGSEAANRRLAYRICPGGFMVLDQQAHKGGPQGVTSSQDTTTVWVVRCL
jgi:hypothetical protein